MPHAVRADDVTSLFFEIRRRSWRGWIQKTFIKTQALIILRNLNLRVLNLVIFYTGFCPLRVGGLFLIWLTRRSATFRSTVCFFTWFVLKVSVLEWTSFLITLTNFTFLFSVVIVDNFFLVVTFEIGGWIERIPLERTYLVVVFLDSITLVSTLQLYDTFQARNINSPCLSLLIPVNVSVENLHVVHIS